MAAARAVEEMRSRVVLGEFGVRNVSSVAAESGGEKRERDGSGDGLSLAAPSRTDASLSPLGSYHRLSRELFGLR